MRILVPVPRIRSRSLSGTATVTDGQTLVLGASPVEYIAFRKKKVPILGDIPILGRLFRSETRSNTKKYLFIFITPTIIDPAGNHVHTPDDLPP